MGKTTRNKVLKIGIRFRLVSFTLAIVVMVGGSITVYAFLNQTKNIAQDFEAHGRNLTTLLAKTLIDPLYELKITNASNLVAAAIENKDVEAVYVLDPEGMVLTDGTEDNNYQFETIESFTAANRIALENERVEIKHSPEHLYISIQVISPGNELLGYLQVVLSPRRAIDRQHEELITLIYIVATLFLVGMIFAFLLAKWFTRPIEAMVEGTEKIKNGHLDTIIKLKRRDELGYLASMINQMTAHLGQTTVSKRFVEDIFRSIHDSVIAVNETMVIEMVNPATSTLLGLDEEKLIGQSFNEFIEMSNGAAITKNELIELTSKQGKEIVFKGAEKTIPVLFSAGRLHYGVGYSTGIV